MTLFIGLWLVILCIVVVLTLIVGMVIYNQLAARKVDLQAAEARARALERRGTKLDKHTRSATHRAGQHEVAIVRHASRRGQRR